ncbi:Hypothetical protein FKW44_009654, partial [Caligus rogercresseyi]
RASHRLENPAACLIPEDRLRSDEEASSSTSSISSSERLFPPEEPENNRTKDTTRLKRRRKSPSAPWTCTHCTIIFPNQTLYFSTRASTEKGLIPSDATVVAWP